MSLVSSIGLGEIVVLAGLVSLAGQVLLIGAALVAAIFIGLKEAR